MHEAQLHECNSFLTLTYDDEHLPQDGSLVLGDWQNFAKKMRNRIGKFRFYHCGEYGDDNDRPHYHALIFGQNFHQDRTPWKRTARGDQLYRSKALEDLWPQGYSTIGQVTLHSARYVARYAMKKVTGDKAKQHYQRIGIQHAGEITQLKPEYTTMSRNPGIGAGWIDAYNQDVYPDDFLVIEGKQQATTRYYDTWLENNNPAEAEKIKRRRKQDGIKHKANKTHERLKVREKVAQAKASLSRRPI